MIINRIGDFALAIGIFIFFYLFKNINYITMFMLAPEYVNNHFIFFNTEINILTLGCLFIFIGCMGKSAQIGLHT
jgi:NADH:ubiquinone oxidoreductase subunit 5 (subunit L)/multisubunit Na+/H+ antiporter MnhA subunit